jgi:hypothetical protein
LIRTEGTSSAFAAMVGCDIKGRVSPFLYVAGIALAFVHPLLADAIYLAVALIWLIPDKRVEKLFHRPKPS